MTTDERTPVAPTRRKGADTRAAIAEAARALFIRQGYTGTSVRQVAALAGADSALVIRYFGSKEQLFLETIPLVGQFEQVTSGPLEGMGRRLVESVLGPERELQRTAYRTLMRASDSESVRARLIAAQEAMFIAPLAPRLVGPAPELRARLIAAQLSGLLDALSLLLDEHILAAERQELVELYGAAMQLLVSWSGEWPPPALDTDVNSVDTARP